MLTEALRSPIAIIACAIWTVVATVAGLRVAGWTGRVTADGHVDVVRRVLRNSAVPIASQLLIRAVDLAVAIALLRLLGPDGNGEYAVAVVVWLYVKTISDFGFSLLATRDIARDRASAPEIIGVTTVARWVVLGVSAAPVALYAIVGKSTGTLSDASVVAIGLLFLSVVPSSYAEAVNSALNGLERMEVAARLNIFVALIRAPLAIVLGASTLGVSGVALAAVLAACVSAAMLRRALHSATGVGTRWTVERAEMLRYGRASWPLLVNALLVNLFFRFDVFIVQAARGDRALGVYDAAYKLINLLTIVPSYGILAVFPILARRSDDPRALGAAQRVTTYALVTIAWVFVVATTALANVAIHVLAGEQYLPEAALLLRILIWFAPLSFLNGVVQYVLVAAGRQRRVVPPFGAAVAFNLAANLLFVPLYGARAAAAVTVLTEVVILVSFVVVTRHTGVAALDRRSIERLWRPTLAGLLAAGVALLLRDMPAVALLASALVFVALAFATRVVGRDERELLRRALTRVA